MAPFAPLDEAKRAQLGEALGAASGVFLAHPEVLGVGIDEGTALLVRDGRFAEVMGTSQVVLVDGRAQKGALLLRLARPGQTVDLGRRRIGD